MATKEACHALSAHVTSRYSPINSGKHDTERKEEAPFLLSASPFFPLQQAHDRQCL